MKSLFSKLSVLLLAAGFAVVGCQDFAEDIRQVEEKVEQSNNTLTQDFTVTTDGLKAEIAALEAQHAADIKAAEEAIAKLKADLEGKIAADIDAAEAALQAAYEAADKALAAQAANDKKELEGKLAEAAANAAKALEDAKAALADAYKNADEKIEAAYKAADDKLKANLENQLGSLKSELEKADATHKSELEAKINATEKALTQAQIDINASIAALDKELSDRMSTLEGNVAGIKESVDNFVKNYEETYKLADTVLKQEIEKELDALKAEYTAGNDDLTKKLADLDEAYKEADETLKASIAAEKQAVLDQLTAEKNALLEKIQGLEKTLNDKDLELEESIAALKTDLEDAERTLKADIDAVEAALKAADENLQKQITENTELIAALQEADKNLDAAIKALEKTHADDKAELDEAIRAEAAARAAALQTLTDIHNADVDDLRGAIKVNADAIAAETKARKDADATLQDNIDAANEALAAAKTALEAADEKLQDAINAEAELRSDEDEKIRQDLAEETLARVADVAALDGRIDLLEAWQVNAQADIDANKAAIAQNTADIVLLKAEDEALQKNIDAAIEKAEKELGDFEKLVADTYATKKELEDGLNTLEQNLTDAINAVDAKVGELTTKVNDYITATNETLAELAQADKDLNDLIYTVKEGLEKAMKEGDAAVLAKLQEAEAALKQGLTDAKNELQGKIDAEEAAREAAITALETALNTKIDGVQTQVTANATALAALETRVKTAEDDIASLAERLDIVEGQVKDLLARIQKMVYLPDYSDGKVTIDYAKIGTNVIESRSELKYKVYPADAAKGVADAADKLRFDVVGVETRAADPALNILSAEADDKGVITFTVEPRNLADEFYAGTKSYSVALVLENGNDSYSTEYANLLATTTPETITVDLYNSAKTVISTKETDAAPVQEIAYLNSTDVKEILPGHYIGFQIGSATEVLTEADMNKAGYEVEVPDAVVSYDYYVMNDDNTIASASDETTAGKYFVPSIVDGVVNVSLAANNAPAAVGFGINPIYSYSLYDSTLEAGSIVQIVKETRKFTLAAKTATWDYNLDAAADAYNYNNTLPSATYNRTFTVPASEITIDNALSQSYPDVVASTPIKVFVNQLEVTPSPVVFGVDGENATVTYTNFEWGKKYNIEAKYDTGATIVSIFFTFETFDRKREPIVVETDPTVSTTEKPLVYKKDMTIAQGTYNVPFGDKLFEELDAAGNIAGIEKDAYLTDVFNNSRPYYEILNSYYNNALDPADPAAFLKDDGGADTWSTRLVIDGATREFTFGYSYKSFAPEVITDLKYVREFTTWYGQKFVLEHVLTIDLPKYDFAHTSYYVKAGADNGWYSKVMGLYTPSINAPDVSAFSVANVDMDMAFNVVDRATATPTIIPAAELATYGLVTEFELESTIPNITITDNEISYLSPEPQIGVTGKLCIENTDGSRLYLRTSFDDTYANYVVKKYDPIGALTVTENPEVDVVDAKVYNINVLEFFKLMDNRNETPVWDLIVDGAFLNGNGTNGYNGLVTTIYGLGVDYGEVIVPANYIGIITFDDVTGILSFDNSGMLTLVEDVIIPVKLKINYTWGSREKEVEVKFKKNDKE